MRKTLAVAGALAVVAATASIALGAIPGSDGVIQGCYVNKVGTLRVIDPGTQQCTRLETSLQWNQTGPQGPKGPKGDKGDTGLQGEAGPQGPPGTFSGAFESPNGQFSLSVTDSGIVLSGPMSSVELNSGGIKIDSDSDVDVSGAARVSINGAMVRLNGCSHGVARTGDMITGTATSGMVTGSVFTGSMTVCTG